MKSYLRFLIVMIFTSLLMIPLVSAQQDSDDDGVLDANDLCPNVFGLSQFRGCPDRDEDGFADPRDDCPNVPGDLRGCPDTDGDGFHDREDQCRDVPGTNLGCPEDSSTNNTGDSSGTGGTDSGGGGTDGNTGNDSTTGDGTGDSTSNSEPAVVIPVVPSDRCMVTPLTQRVNVRPQPDTDNTPVAVLEPGQLYPANFISGDWVQLETGWAIANALQISIACPVREQDSASIPDTDADGISNTDDTCPDEPGSADNDGCPPERVPAYCYGMVLRIIHLNLAESLSLEFYVISDGQRISETATVSLNPGEVTFATLYLRGLEPTTPISIGTDLPQGITMEVLQLSRQTLTDNCTRDDTVTTISNPGNNLNACYLIDFTLEAVISDRAIVEFFAVTDTAIPATDAISFAITGSGIQDYRLYMPGQNLPDSNIGLVINFDQVDEDEAIRVQSRSIQVVDPVECQDGASRVPAEGSSDDTAGDVEPVIVIEETLPVRTRPGDGSGGNGTGDGSGSFEVLVYQFMNAYGTPPPQFDAVEVQPVMISTGEMTLANYTFLESSQQDIELRIENESDECVVEYSDVSTADVMIGNPGVFTESCPPEDDGSTNTGNFKPVAELEIGEQGEEASVDICPVSNGHEAECPQSEDYLCVENWVSNWDYDLYACDLEEFNQQKANGPWRSSDTPDDTSSTNDTSTTNPVVVQGITPTPMPATSKTVSWNNVTNSGN